MVERPMVGARIPQQWKEELENIARYSKKSVSQILHDLISEYLQRETDNDGFLSSSESSKTSQPESIDTELITLLSEQIDRLSEQIHALAAELPEQIALKLQTIKSDNWLAAGQMLEQPEATQNTLVLEQQALDQRTEFYLSQKRKVSKPQNEFQHVRTAVNKQLSQESRNSSVPQSLSTKALARRLGVSDTAIRKAQRSKTAQEFALWTKQSNPRYGKLADPNNVMWKYNPDDKRFYPVSSAFV